MICENLVCGRSYC